MRQSKGKLQKRLWVAWSQQQFLYHVPEDTIGLLRLIAQIRVGNRPGRVETRLFKRRLKPFPRLQTTLGKAQKTLGYMGDFKGLRLKSVPFISD